MLPRSIVRKSILVARVAGFALLASLFIAGAVQAETIKIVALGASNTGGSGVGSSQAWPARLEAMLRAKGYDVTMRVNAVTGDTSAGIAARAASAASGARVVVFDVGKGNDQDRGSAGSSAANRAQIERSIRAQGAKPVFAAYARIVGSEKSNPSAWAMNDVHHHLTAQSHARVAAALLPQVIAAIGKK